MKHIFSLFLFLLFLNLSAQDAINFETGTFQEILDKAKKENKLVFMDAFAAWCGPCKLMEKNIFTKQDVSNFYNSNFINARFDMEKGEGRDIAKKYGVRSYPTFLFLNGNGELVSQNYGYMSEPEFIAIGKEASNPENVKYSLAERLEKGESDPGFLINVMKQNAESNFSLAKKASERYFEVKKTKEYSKEDVGYLLYFLRYVDDPNFKIFEKDKTEISNIITPEVYQQFDESIRISGILEKSLDQSKGTINEDFYFKNAIPLIGKQKADEALNRMKVSFYPEVQNYAAYEKAALAYYANADAFTSQELLKAAWIFSQHISTPSSLKKAEEWAEKSVSQSETPENTYILAKIYQKTGKKVEALKYAEYSKNLAEQQGADANMATLLIKELK